MKKVPKKNYITVLLISVLTFVIVGYFAFWYTETKEYDDSNSIMDGYLLEIGENEIIVNLSNYIIDNPNTVLYVSYGNDSHIKNFEKEFKKYINDNNIKHSFVYVDLNRLDDNNFTNEFKDNFFSNELKNKNFKLEKQSNLFVFKAGKIKSILYYSKQPINMVDVNVYLENEGIIDYD